MSLIEGPFEGLEIQMTSSSSSTMIIRSPISTSAKNFVYVSTRVQSQMGSNICAAVSRGPSGSSSVYLHPGPSKTNSSSSSISRMVKWVGSAKGPQRKQVEVSLACQNLNMRLLVPKQGMLPRIKCNVGPVSWPQGCASAGLIFGLLVCSSSSAAHAEAPREKEDDSDVSHVKFAHGKKVYTDYSVIGIPGDGRCLFRSVAHGACLRSGEAAPSYRCQRELADDLRAQVADEFIKRRTETEWFVEGDFDTYVSEMRKPHVWGGEPELFMASHVLQMPITVYMFDEDAGGLISIAEYGQEYGNENPIRVLYHGFGHYDALQIPGKKVGGSRL